MAVTIYDSYRHVGKRSVVRTSVQSSVHTFISTELVNIKCIYQATNLITGLEGLQLDY